MSETRKPFWIGAFVLGGLLLLAGALLLLGRDTWFRPASQYVVYFTGALDGLSVGADVTYRGVKVGTVRDISLSFDPQLQDVVMPVVVSIDPVGGRDAQRMDLILERLIERGLRAQLQTQSLVTGQAVVALDMFPGRPGYVREPNEVDLKAIPSVPSRVDQAADIFRDLAASMRQLPLEEMVVSLNNTLQAVERLADSPQLRDGLGNLNATMANLESLTQQLQRQVPSILDNVERSSAEVADVLDEVRQAVQIAQGALQDMQGLAGEALGSLGPQSEVQYELLRTLEQMGQASKALQRTAEGLQQQPESLIFGQPR